MPRVRWRKFRSYSGPQILGDKQDMLDLMQLGQLGPRRNFHVDRAYWLTTQVESGGRLGSIVMYDGTGVTAGLDQHVAVYPRELAHEDYNAKDDQGSFWKLLRRMEVASSLVGITGDQIENLWRAFEEENWYVSQDGRLRYLSDDKVRVPGHKILDVKAGDLVFGFHIRDVFTPPRGAVPRPKKGSEWAWAAAKEWALLFHDLFSSDYTPLVRAQTSFGLEHLVKRTKARRVKTRDGTWKDVEKLAYGDLEVTSLQIYDRWTEELDLALCVYQSHSVNAPAIANRAVARAHSKHGALSNDFARTLVRFLGNSRWGRWDDDIKHGRYQRTRSAARASGLWSRSLFDGKGAIMPKDLPG